MNTPTQKFLFTRSFDGANAEAVAATKAAAPPSYDQAHLEAACAAAHAEGMAAGDNAARHRQEAQLAVLSENLAGKVGQLLAEAESRRQQQSDEIREIALVIARKILPEIVAKHALDAVCAQINQLCREMSEEPRLVVRVAENLLDPLERRLDGILHQQAYRGKIILLADPDMIGSDSRIEWADGGIEHNGTELWQKLDLLLRHSDAGATSHDVRTASYTDAFPSTPSVSLQE
jgi:flagellar assembly protein FliH